MPSFKQKPSKKIKVNKKNLVTLDNKHREIINEIYQNETYDIPNLLKEKGLCKKKFEEEKNSLKIDEILDLQDKIDIINENIKSIKNKKKKYYLDNSKYIFEYFENKKNISNCEKEENKNKTQAKTNNIINKFFKLDIGNVNKEDIDKEEQNKKNKNIVHKYLCNLDDTFIDINNFVFPADICRFCHKGELIPVDDDGILMCNSCFKSIPFLIENEKPSYKEPPKEVCFYAYKKINHFKEILSQFQGKETTQISEEIIDNIKLQIKKERINLENLTHSKTKEILKKLGYNKHYEHITFIKNKLGIKPIIMTPELEEILCNLFIEIQPAYAKHVPDYRVNFLNYYYVLYKLCELLEETQYLQHIPMLKDREKLIEQDIIWCKMCKTLDWEYKSSI